MTDETPTPDGGGRFNHFEGGSIYWHPQIGAIRVSGAIREKWSMYGWERGFFGYPTRDATTSGSVLSQEFQGCLITFDATSCVVRVTRSPSVAAPIFEVAIHAIRARDTNGARATTITQDEIREWVNWANRIFEVTGIRFTYNGAIATIDDTDVNNGDPSLPRWTYVKNMLDQVSRHERNLVVLFRFGPDATRPTGGGFSSEEFVVMPQFGTNNRCPGQENVGMLAHELGHFFGLPHTMRVIFDTEDDAKQFFISNSLDPLPFDQDWSVVSDTAPDPFIGSEQCRFDTRAYVWAGKAVAIERENIMSYYHCDFVHKTFSWQQTIKMRDNLLARRAAGLNVVEVTR